MPTNTYQTHNRFAVEGLESRILLSAVPMDAVMETEEQPQVYEVQYVAESTEAAVGVSEDVLFEGAVALAGAEAGDVAALIVSSAGVFDASGQLLQAIEPGMQLVADAIHVADGTVLESVSLQADAITFGIVTWAGDNYVAAAQVSFDGAQVAQLGATLQLAPGADDAPIYLGQPVDGVDFGLDSQVLSLLSQADFALLTIGADAGSHLFTIDGLEYRGNLTLQASTGEGEFSVLSEVVHSGGTLTYVGTGSTQFTSADTLTEGVPVVVDDSVELVYTVENANAIRIDTTDGGNTAGANISITGDIRGTDEGGGGTLFLNAGTGGTILIGGNIGTSKAIQRIVIENAAEVIIEGNIQVEIFEVLNGRGDVILGTDASNFVRVQGLVDDGLFNVRTVNNITINGDFEMPELAPPDPNDGTFVAPAGDAVFEITGAAGARQLWIKGETNVANGDLSVVSAGRVLMSNDVFVSGTLSQAAGVDNTRFESNVTAGIINLRANNQIRFSGEVQLLSGDLTLITNNIDFVGGVATVSGALNASNESLSNAFFRPISAAGEMNIGSPVGAGSNFAFTTSDIAALENGWNSIVFGHATGSSNLARIGTASFLDAVTVHAGSILVNGPFAARTGLTLNTAAAGGMTFTNAAVVSVVNEQVNNVWQPSAMTMTADLGDIIFNNSAFAFINNTVNPVTGTPASTLTMTATVGDIRDQSATPGFQEARDMHLSAAGNISLYTRTQNLWAESTVEGDIDIVELNALRVQSAIAENGAISVDTGGLTQIDYAQSVTDHVDNTVTVSALGSILVGEILAGTAGNVSLTAENAITRIGGLTDPEHRIVGDLLTMVAETGIGQIATPLLIRTNGLDAENLTSGDIRITHDGLRDALTVRLQNDSLVAGDLVSLDVLDADVRVTAVSNASDGGVYLAAVGDLELDGQLASNGGAVFVSATGTIDLAAASSVQSGGADVSLVAATGLTMAADASVVSSGGQINLSSNGNVLIGTVDARDDAAAPGVKSTWGDVALIAGGWLRDHDGSDQVNAYADQLHLRGENGIGQLPAAGSVERALEVDAGLLAAHVGSSGAIALAAISDLATGVPAGFTFDLLDESGAILAGSLASAPLAGVLNAGSDGAILLSVDGSLTLQSNQLALDSSALATTAAATVVLVAEALTVEDAILSNGGSISADVTGIITLGAGVTVATSGLGTIALRSSADSILAAANSTIETGATAIVLSAQNNLELGSVSAVGGAVGLTTVTGSLQAATGGVNDRTVVTAETLAIVAGGQVNGPTGSGERLRVSVATISLTGGTGSDYRIDNNQDLLIDTTDASAQLYSSLMDAAPLAIAPQNDFTVSGAGNIDLNVDGNLALAASRTINTTGAGNIDLVTGAGLSMGALSLVGNEAGTINVTAVDAISVARIASVSGDIRVESQNGVIIDSDPSQLAVLDFATAGHLELLAANGIGIDSGARDILTVSIGSLSATTVAGGVFISSADSFTVNDVLTTGTLVPVVLTSGGSLTFAGTVAATGDVVLRADVDFTQQALASIIAGLDLALQSGADMTLARVETPGAVALEVMGALMGYASPAQAAVAAEALLLNQVGSVGTPAQPLLTAVERLAGSVTDGALALANQGDLTLGSVTVETTPVGTADTLPLAPRVQTGDRVAVAGSGSGIFIEVDGSFTTESVVNASLETVSALPVLVQSAAGQSWNGRFSLAGGSVTLRAGGSVTLDASDTFSTTGGALLIESGGQFALAGTSVLSRDTGNLLIDAAGNIILGGQISGAGHAALLSGDAILAGAANHVQATDLILSSAQGIAAGNQSLVTNVARLAVRTGAAGVFLENTGDLAISNLGFGILSLAPGAAENAAFSGFVGGAVAAQGGTINIDNDGEVTIDPIAASINALPGSDLAFSVLADATGSAGNGISVFIVRDDPDIAPLTADYSSEDRSLIIYIENGVNTLGEILNVINSHLDFPGVAVLAGGSVDGSTVFDLPGLASSAFIASGGSEDGMRTEVAGVLTAGAEAIASSAQLLVPESFFTIRITSDQTGALINNVTVRLLSEGPLEVADGGRLNPGTNAATIDWDGSEFLDVYVNVGFTTVGTVINRINQQVGIPFSAQLGGTFDSSSLQVVLGDAPVLMESNLSASATLRPVGNNNDFTITASNSGPLYNGISFVFLDDGTVPDDGAQASFNPVSNVMTLRIQSGVTTGNQLIAALNAEGTFTAALKPELDSVNVGSGAVHAQRFLTSGGAVAVPAVAVLRMVGSDNDVTLTANDFGDDFNNIEIRLVANSNAAPGSVAVAYNSVLKRLTLTVNPLFTSAAQVVDAVNAATTPFTASSNGSGTFALAQYPLTSGGTGAVARAEFFAAGDDNNFEITANSESTALINTRVFLIDDGTINNGSATATYLSGPRRLIINLQSGVTTANAVLAAINAPSIPMTATLLSGNDGSGVYHVDAAVFAGGVDAISATATVELPSGAIATVVADAGGIAANGIQIAFAIDSTLPADSAAVSWFDLGGKRILQLRVDSASTQLSVIAAALAADTAVPFTLTGDLASAVGDLASVDGSFNEGHIRLTAAGDISLLGRIDSQTGRVLLTASNGDLTFDAAAARIDAIDGVMLNASGNFANLASLESPLVQVFGEALLSLTTGSQSLVSSQSVYFLSGGDIVITGAGFAVQDGFDREQSVRLEAANDIQVDAAVRTVAATINAEGIVFTVVKSEVDGGDQPLSETTPVAIEENGGNYTIYVLPGVATHADIISAINDLELDGLSVFFANLGRQQGSLGIGDHTFFITSQADAIIQNVSIAFADLDGAPVAANFVGTTLNILLGEADNATVQDLLVALNGLSAFAATTSTLDTAAFLRGDAARDFENDYAIEIVADTEQSQPVVLDAVGDSFTLSLLPGVATRLDLLDALTGTGLFAGTVPALDSRLQIGDFVFFLNTGAALSSVNLDVGFVEAGTLAANFDAGTGALNITLNNVDAASGQDVRAALEALDFIVFSLDADLSILLDTAAATADLGLIPDGTRTAPLTLDSPVSVTFPVNSEGVFADVLFEVEGMLVALNWLLPVVGSTYTTTTFADSRSSLIVDDVSSPAATLSYGDAGVFASSILTIDGVNIAIAAHSANLTLNAGNDVLVTASGLLGGGAVDVDAGSTLTIAGAIEGGDTNLSAVDTIDQSGTIEATGTGEINLTSSAGAILMSGTASTRSVSGPIFYQAAGEIAVVAISSSDAGRIDVVSGAAITDALSNNDLNLSTSGFVALTAQTGIGAIGTAAINTLSGTLQLRNFGTSGDIVITELAAGGTLTVSELTQNATDGWSILNAAAGDVFFTGAVFHLSGGALRVEASDSIITEASAPIILNGGLLTFLAGGSIELNAEIDTAGGDAWLAANSGTFAMLAGITLNAGSGHVRVSANGDSTLAQIQTTGSVRVESNNGSILRAALSGRTNLIATSLQLYAGLNVGSLASDESALITDVSLLNATAASGVLAVRERNDLSLGQNTVEVAFAEASRTTNSAGFTASQWLQSGLGDAVLRVGGSLEVESIALALPTVSVAGNFHVNAVGAVTVDGAVELTGGALQWVAGDSFTLSDNLTVAGGSLLLQAGATFTQAAAAVITVDNANAVIESGAAMTVGSIDLGSGDLALSAAGALLQHADQLIEAGQIRLAAGAGIASAADPFSFDANRISAVAGGAMFLNSSSTLSVDTVAAIEVDTVTILGALGTVHSVAAQSDLTTTANNGSIILTLDAGDLTLNGGLTDGAANTAVSAHGTGNILLDLPGELVAHADVRSGSGHISLVAGNDVVFNATADITTTGAATLYLESTAGDIRMDDNTRFSTGSGDVVLQAAQGITLGGLSTSGSVALFAAAGAILDGGDTYRDVIADGLLLNAGTTIGLSTDALELTVATVSARAANGGIFLNESNGLVVDDVSASVERVDAAAQTVTTPITAQSDLLTLAGDGSIVVQLTAGNLTLNDGTAALNTTAVSAHGGGNVLLQTLGGSLTGNADILSGNGHISLLATGALLLTDDVSVTTSGLGSLTLVSANSTLTQNSGSTLTAVNGDIILEANGNVSIAGMTTSANVGIVSTTGAIIDNEAARINIEASDLRLRAGVAIGSGTNPLETEVRAISAAALGGGIFLSEVDAINVTTTAAETAVVLTDASTEQKALALQSGLTASNSGAIVLVNQAGDITVVAGNTVTATVNGRILLDAANDLAINANVSTGAGNITLTAGNDFNLAADITVTTGVTGQIHVLVGGLIDTAANSRFINGTGNVVLSSTGDITLSGIQSSGRVALISASGSILNAGADAFTREVIGSQLLISAVNGSVGSDALGQTLRTQVARVAAESRDGLYLTNASGLRVDAVTVPYRTVNADGTFAAELSPSLTGAITATAADREIRLTVETQNLTLGHLSAESVYVNVLAGSILDGAYTATQIVAAEAELIAANSIGAAGASKLDTQIETLAVAAGVTVGSSIFLSNSTGLIIGTVGSTSGATAENGIFIEADGSIELSEGFTASSGNGLLHARSGDLVIDAAVSTGNHLSLLADGSIEQNAEVSAGGTLDVNAALGSFAMLDGVTATASDNARITAASSILLGGLNAANIRLEAGTWIDTAGSIDLDLVAGSVQLVAASFIGQAQGTANGPLQTSINSIAATAATGSLYLSNDKNLIVATVAAIDVNRVQIDNTAPVLTGSQLAGLATDQFIKVVADGNLIVNAAVLAENEDLLLQALSGNLTVNAAVTSGDNASILASAAISMGAVGSLDITGSLDIQAAAGALTMADGATASALGNLRMLASGDIRLAGVSAANAYLNAGAAIIDNGDTHTDLAASQVQLIAGDSIGEPEGTNFGLLDITADALAVQSGGAVFLDNSSDLALTTVAPINVLRIGLDSSSSLQTGVTLSGLNAATAVIVTTEGSFTIDQAVATLGAANILLEARADTSDLSISAPVTTAGGNLSLLAGRDLTLSGTANVTVTAASGTVDLQARLGSIDQAAALTIQTTNANILLQAAVDVRLGMIEAGNGSVGITASSGSILDNKARAANVPNNISANALSMIAGGDIGLVGAGADNAIEIRVNTLSATTTLDGSIHIREFDSLLVDTIAAFSANRVITNNLTSTASSAMEARSDVRTAGNGDVILRSVGSMTLNGGLAGAGANTAVAAAGTGNVLLDVLAINGDIFANAQVLAESGSISLLAGRGIALAGNANVIIANGTGTIDLNAARGNITQAASLRAETAGGNILFRARDNVQLGLLDARNGVTQSNWGSVGVIASTGSITDAKARSNSAVNLYAAAANLTAAGSIGTLGLGVDNAVETDVLTLAAATTVNGSINIRQTDDLAIDTVTSFTVNRVAPDATTGVSSTTVAPRSDLRTAGNGAIVLRLNTGDLTLNAGLAGPAENEAVVAGGAGSILLKTLSGSLTANADILSGTGLITLSANSNVTLSTGVDVASAADISIAAATGTLSMNGSATVVATGASARLAAALDLTLGNVTAANVSLVAGSDIVNAAGSVKNVSATNLRIESNGSAGTAARHLSTDVANLTAAAATGSIFITEDNAVNVRDIQVTVSELLGNATTTTVTDASQSDLVTLANGDITLLATLGDIILTDGVNGDGIAVSADGSGSISIAAPAGVVIAQADIISGSGLIDLNARKIQFSGTINSAGGINLTATDGAIVGIGENATIDVGNSPLHLSSTHGIGSTGAGALKIVASALTIDNSVKGNVYVDLLSAATIEGISLAGRGDLYLNQLDFAMTLNGTISVEDGRIVLQTRQALTVSADVTSGRDIRLTSNSLSVDAGVAIEAIGDILLRALADVTFGSSSTLVAGDALSIAAGGDLRVAAATAGGRMDLRAAGSILRVDGSLAAPFMRLVANSGSLGSAANELMLAAGRLDVASATGLHLIQQGDVTIGRAGLLSNAGAGETISLSVLSGMLTSAQGEIRFDGSGALLLDVDGELRLGSAVLASDGDIIIDTEQLSITAAASGVILQAANGRVSITSLTGIGAESGPTAEVVVAADELTATTASGSLNLVLDQATQILGNGVQVNSGAGTLRLAVNSGDLTANAPIRQMGSGAIDLAIQNGNLWINDLIRQNNGGSLAARVFNGHLTMGLSGRVETTTGAMNLRAASNIWLSRVQSTSGQITIRSDNESVRRLTGLSTSFANIVSSSRPTVQVAKQARFSVDSNSVQVNSIIQPRGSSQSLITISLDFT
jgi:hypothetical protein